MTANLIAAFLIGLTSSAHCVFMCGGIAASLSVQQQAGAPAWQINSLFHLGRITSYALIALLFASLLGLASNSMDLGIWLRLFAGALLIAMGLYLANIWRGLSYIERAMEPVWRPIATRLKQHIPARNGKDALVTGLLWGWLPCGLIYSTLAWASSTADSAFQAAMLMVAMGLGATPTLLGINLFGQFFRQRSASLVSGLAVCLFGLWTMLMPLMSLLNSDSHPHHHELSTESVGAAQVLPYPNEPHPLICP